MDETTNKLVTVLDTAFIHEIQIAKTLLSKKNIPSYIFNENMSNIIGTAISEGYMLKVNSADEKKARKLLIVLTEDEN
ncbi:DUF2007 domain-containing protein [Lutibacter sp. TH_r2]|uniref:putative signal transducing protein n=1 Tax=Lutibacter sp. TH_r2 TaxID=3082083 RepID=UPI0029530B9A|nr:DUF2007 domain-containing protein [Lutibacter sp. TH_r2]MDV7187712.1 DUF2007 domain-containing protein [Lutibacter sp. TH_r2]